MVIEFFGNYISKCPNLMKKRTPVPAYILLLSLSNKLKFLVNHYGTQTVMRVGEEPIFTMILYIGDHDVLDELDGDCLASQHSNLHYSCTFV